MNFVPFVFTRHLLRYTKLRSRFHMNKRVLSPFKYHGFTRKVYLLFLTLLFSFSWTKLQSILTIYIFTWLFTLFPYENNSQQFLISFSISVRNHDISHWNSTKSISETWDSSLKPFTNSLIQNFGFLVALLRKKNPFLIHIPII